MHKLFITFLITTNVLSWASGCASLENRSYSEKQDNTTIQQRSIKIRLIIKFKSGIDPLQTGFIKGLSRDANANLSYLHAMSGEAHVFLVDMVDTKHTIDYIIKNISKRADVLFVEQDEIMHHQ